MPDRSSRRPSGGPFLTAVGEGPVTFDPAELPLRGSVSVPGDKSVSHRAVLLAAVNDGPVSVTGFLRSADTLATVAAVRALGISIEEEGTNLVVEGAGWGGLSEPENVIDAHNSGTLIRLLPGLVASRSFLVVVTGDQSVRRRPMSRIAEPLRAMGVMVTGRDGGRLAPLVVRGGRLNAIEHPMEVSSAQVKSCVLIAGLRAEGETTVHDPGSSRDHTERMLRYAGVSVESGREGGGVTTTVQPTERLQMGPVVVPGDPSSAAFLLAAAALVAGSSVTVEEVGLNPTRTGFFEVLARMGVDISVEEQQISGPEPAGAVSVRGGPELEATDIGPEEAPRLIDELPLWAVVAAWAHGTSRLRGARELRFKESDRLTATADLLRALGVQVTEHEDGLDIVGDPGGWDGGFVRSHSDHRLAMAGAVAGLASREGVTVDEVSSIAVSFPGFAGTIDSLRSGAAPR